MKKTLMVMAILSASFLGSCSKTTTVVITGSVVDSKHNNKAINSAQISDVHLLDEKGNSLNSVGLSTTTDANGNFTVQFNATTPMNLIHSFSGKVSANCSSASTPINFAGRVTFSKSVRNGLNKNLLYSGQSDGEHTDGNHNVLYSECN